VLLLNNDLLTYFVEICSHLPDHENIHLFCYKSVFVFIMFTNVQQYMYILVFNYMIFRQEQIMCESVSSIIKLKFVNTHNFVLLPISHQFSCF